MKDKAYQALALLFGQRQEIVSHVAAKKQLENQSQTPWEGGERSPPQKGPFPGHWSGLQVVSGEEGWGSRR